MDYTETCTSLGPTCRVGGPPAGGKDPRCPFMKGHHDTIADDVTQSISTWTYSSSSQSWQNAGWRAQSVIVCSVGCLNLQCKTSLIPSRCVFRFLDDLISTRSGPVLPLAVVQQDIFAYRRRQVSCAMLIGNYFVL